MPTTAHLPDAWIMGYDLYPMDTLAAKKAFVPDAVDAATRWCSSNTIRRWPPAIHHANEHGKRSVGMSGLTSTIMTNDRVL